MSTYHTLNGRGGKSSDDTPRTFMPTAAMMLGLASAAGIITLLSAGSLLPTSAQTSTSATSTDAVLAGIAAEITAVNNDLRSIATSTPTVERNQIISRAAARLASLRDRLIEIRRQEVINRSVETLAAIRAEIAALPATSTPAEKQAFAARALERLSAVARDLASVSGGTVNEIVYLRRGNRNSAVSILQSALKKDPAIYPQGHVTGFYGSNTEAAVRRFQEMNGLTVTGTVNESTLQKLIQVYGTELQDIRFRVGG